jgi:hypothetical protein
MNMVSRYVSIREASRITGRSDFNLRKMLRRGYIEGRKIGVKIWMVGLDREGEVVWRDVVGGGLDSGCKTGVKSVKGLEEDGC